MGRCDSCGQALGSGQRFCTDCGARVSEDATSAPGGDGCCRKCGAAISTDDSFCTVCGAQQPARPSTDRLALEQSLLEALLGYRQLLDDLHSGALPPEEFQAAALELGAVHAADALWLLDLERGVWWRYDGLGMTTASEQSPNAGGLPDLAGDT